MNSTEMLRRRYRKLLYWHLVERWIHANAVGLHFVSEGERSDYRSTWGIVTPTDAVVPNILEIPAEAALWPGPADLSRPRFAYFGRYDVWHKGLDLALTMLRALRGRGIDAQLHLYGAAGAYAATVRRLLAAYGDVPVVDHGFVGGPERFARMAGHDVYLQYSRFEVFGLSLAEAMGVSWGERSVEYAVVHGLERYPMRIGRDLDVAIGRESVAGAVETAVACGRDHGFGTVRFSWSHWGLYQLALLDPEESVALALDLLCTTDVWRAKAIQLVDEPQLERIAAGDDQLGPFRISEEGRFLKSCVRPLLCGDLSRVAAGREWSLPVRPPHPVHREQLEELLGEAGAGALARASSPGELAAS